jgi:hypothetical protein
MAMTYEQAMEALRNADASGDTEDAAKLAEIADRLRPTTPKAPVYTGDIPTEVDGARTPIAPKNSISDKIAQTVSGGKYGTMQDIFFGGEKPEDSTLGKASQLVNSSGLEGLTGIGPVGQATMKGTKLASKASEYVPEAIPKILEMVANSPTVKNTKEVLSKFGEKVSNIPANVLASRTKLSPQDIKDVYALGKEGNPTIMKAFREHQDTDFPLDSIANYNYAMSLGVPPNVARMTTHYNKQLDSGAHMLKNLWENQMPEGLKISPERFQQLRQELMAKLDKLPPEQAKAEILGIKTGDLIQPGKRAMQNNIAESLGFGGLGTLASHFLLHTLAPGASAAVLPFITKSPKIASELALRTGQASRLADKYIAPTVKKYVPAVLDAPVSPQMLGATADISEKDGGSIYPMSLKHVYYHRKKRNG